MRKLLLIAALLLLPVLAQAQPVLNPSLVIFTPSRWKCIGRGLHAGSIACQGKRLTCAATTRQPSAVRNQVWLWRPVRGLPVR